MLFFFNDKKPSIYKNGPKVGFQLGGYYTGNTSSTRKSIFQFIQVTPKGYNFLNILTGQCLYKKTLFVCKNDLPNCQGDLRYFDLRFREGIIRTLNLLEPLAMNELPDVLLKIQSRKKKSR